MSCMKCKTYDVATHYLRSFRLEKCPLKNWINKCLSNKHLALFEWKKWKIISTFSYLDSQNDESISKSPGNDHFKRQNEREKEKNEDCCCSKTSTTHAASEVDSPNDPQVLYNTYDHSDLDNEPYNILKLSFRDELANVEYHPSQNAPAPKKDSSVKFDVKSEKRTKTSNTNNARQLFKSREERKHQKEILRQLTNFKPKTKDNSHKKQLRYSFAESSERIWPFREFHKAYLNVFLPVNLQKEYDPLENSIRHILMFFYQCNERVFNYYVVRSWILLFL